MKEGKTLDNSYNEDEKYTQNKIMQAIVEKCDFYYDDALLSKETIIIEYLKFLSKQFNPKEKTISFAFHTGSKCFDMVSLPALLIASLFYGFSSIDEILINLTSGDMVLYKNERCQFLEFKKFDDKDYIVLSKKVKKGNPLTSSLPYEKNKNLIAPYYGESENIGGQGVKKISENRADFISYILDIPILNVPPILDYSVVVVAKKDEIKELNNHLNIQYKDKKVKLTDIVPITYYTENFEKTRIGENPLKAEAVIKVASNISIAKRIVLNKDFNKARGVFIANSMPKNKDYSELTNILNRNALNFAIITEPLNFEFCDWAMKNYESANFFACTRDYLEKFENDIYDQNEYTEDLNNKIVNIICHHIDISSLSSNFCYKREDDYEEKDKSKIYKNFLDDINKIKNNSDFKDNEKFYYLAWGLITLFSKSFTTMNQVEKLILNGDLDKVESPIERLNKLSDIAFNANNDNKQVKEIGFTFLKMYYSLYDDSPKENQLIKLLSKYANDDVALVVPKKYFVKIFESTLQLKFNNVKCIYANKFNREDKYDVIIIVGDIKKFKNFNIFECFSSSDIFLLCYDFEEKSFLDKKKRQEKIESKLNKKILNQLN